MVKIKQIDTRIERNRIILELYDYIENNTNMPAAYICSSLYKNLSKDVKSRKDFAEFFSDDSNLVIGIGEKSLKVIREFFNITEVIKSHNKNSFKDSYIDNISNEKKKTELINDIRKYLDNTYPDYKFNNGICNAVARCIKQYNVTTKEELKTLIYKSNTKVRGIGVVYKDKLIDYFYN